MKLKMYTLFFTLLLLSGCTPYQPWLEDVFYQGEKVDKHTAIVRQYLRTEHVYDQFTTLAHFDVLWLSDEVRSAYAKVHACKQCMSDERYTAFLRRQIEENRHYISFYVLSAIPNRCGKPLLTEKDALWSMCLKIGQHVFKPIEIKVVELPPEYIMFFGKTYNRFKTPYLVKFDAQEINGSPLLAGHTGSLQMIFSRTDRKAYLTWCLNSCGRVIRKDLSKNSDVLAYDLDCC